MTYTPSGPTLIGRSTELAIAFSAVTVRAGVVLVGPAGVGKTSVARSVISRLDPRRTCVVWLAATAAGRPVPFRAVAALMPASVPAEVTVVLPHVLQTLRARASGRRIVLVVDDAHLLDGPSAAVILGLAGQCCLILTVCSGVPRPDAVTALWKNGYLERVALGLLDVADSAGLAGALVGGPIAGPTADMLHQWTAGNALFLTEMVRAGLADGSLVEVAGLWWWRAPLEVPPTLADLLDRRLDGIGAQQRDALTAVALGEPMALDLLERVVSPDTVVQLEDDGLVRAEADAGAGGLVVRFGHPLLGATVRGRLSAARRRRTAARLLGAASGTPGKPIEIVQRARWHLDSGGPIDADLLLAASGIVLHADPALAERLSAEAARRSPSAEASIALTSALVELGRPGEARAVLEKAAADALMPTDQIAVAVALAGHRAWAERDPDAGREQLAALLTWVDGPAVRCEVQSVDALVLLFGGRADQALALA